MLHKSDASDLSRFSKILTHIYVYMCVYVYLTVSGEVSVVGVGVDEGRREGDSSESVHCALV